MKQEDDSMYVGFQNSAELRKSVLEAARASLETVQNHSRVKHIQDDKLKHRTELARLLREIKEDVEKLEQKLPKHDIQLPQMPMKHKPSEHKLDKIEAALSEIEQRLKSL